MGSAKIKLSPFAGPLRQPNPIPASSSLAGERRPLVRKGELSDRSGCSDGTRVLAAGGEASWGAIPAPVFALGRWIAAEMIRIIYIRKNLYVLP